MVLYFYISALGFNLSFLTPLQGPEVGDTAISGNGDVCEERLWPSRIKPTESLDRPARLMGSTRRHSEGAPGGRVRLTETQVPIDPAEHRRNTCLWPADVGPAWVMPHTVCPGLLAPHKELVWSGAKGWFTSWGASRTSVRMAWGSPQGSRLMVVISAGGCCGRPPWVSGMSFCP